MSLDRHALDRIDDIHSCGGLVVQVQTRDLGGTAVLIRATVAFGWHFDAQLIIREVVRETERGEAHREQYSYHLIYRDRFLFRYDRDPDNHPEMPEHKHLPPDERRLAWGRVTFRDVLDETYMLVAEFEATEEAQG